MKQFILFLVVPAFIAALCFALFLNSAYADAHNLNGIIKVVAWVCTVWVLVFAGYRFYKK